MKYSHPLGIRFGRRIMQLTRFGLFSVMLLPTALFHLIATLAYDFARIAGHMAGMDRYFDGLSRWHINMDMTLVAMQESAGVMPDLEGTPGMTGESAYRVPGDMDVMAGDAGKRQGNVSRMPIDLDTMSRPMDCFHFR